MQDIHDERRVPLELEPESRSFLDSIRFWLDFGRTKQSKREAAQAKAAAQNAPHRDIEARTLAALSRVGRGK